MLLQVCLRQSSLSISIYLYLSLSIYLYIQNYEILLCFIAGIKFRPAPDNPYLPVRSTDDIDAEYDQSIIAATDVLEL